MCGKSFAGGTSARTVALLREGTDGNAPARISGQVCCRSCWVAFVVPARPASRWPNRPEAGPGRDEPPGPGHSQSHRPPAPALVPPAQFNTRLIPPCPLASGPCAHRMPAAEAIVVMSFCHSQTTMRTPVPGLSSLAPRSSPWWASSEVAGSASRSIRISTRPFWAGAMVRLSAHIR